MCFQNKRENAHVFPIIRPKILETRVCFLSWRDGFLETHMCFLCFHVFPKTAKSRFLSWDVHRLTGSSPGQRIFQKENAKKNAAQCVEDRGNASMVVQKWRNYRLLAVTCTFCLCRMQKLYFTKKITQKMNRCKFGKRTPVKSYESYNNLSYTLGYFELC